VKKTILGIVTKSPWPKGRRGSREKQDWYQTCIDAVCWKKVVQNAQIVVPCATQPTDGQREVEYYVQAVKELGGEIEAIDEGYETVAQIKIFGRLARERKSDLILFTTFTHYPRIAWICWWNKIPVKKLVVAWGIPRPREACTDLVLIFLYPMLDVLGLMDWFITKVINRRLEGKL